MTTRSVKIALVASLLVNIFLIGALIGGATSIHHRNARTIGPPSMRIAGTELPRDERRAFRRALRSARAAAKPQIEASRAAREHAAYLLEQRVFDRSALDKALADSRAADFAVRAQVEAAATTFIANLTPADRMRLAEAMRRRTEAQR